MAASPSALAQARKIIARLKAMPADTDVLLEFWNLDALPPEVVREALESWVGPAPVLPKPLRLRVGAVVEDADVLDLGPIAEAQLRFAGKSWDGVDMEPEERLDGELEGTFAGTLRHETLVNADSDADAAPLFELLRFHENCGVVFRAGTAEPVALLADGVVETRDKALRPTLEALLVGGEPATAANATKAAKTAKATKATKVAKPKAAKATRPTKVAKTAKPKAAKATKVAKPKATKGTKVAKTGKPKAAKRS